MIRTITAIVCAHIILAAITFLVVLSMVAYGNQTRRAETIRIGGSMCVAGDCR